MIDNAHNPHRLITSQAPTSSGGRAPYPSRCEGRRDRSHHHGVYGVHHDHSRVHNRGRGHDHVRHRRLCDCGGGFGHGLDAHARTLLLLRR